MTLHQVIKQTAKEKPSSQSKSGVKTTQGILINRILIWCSPRWRMDHLGWRTDDNQNKNITVHSSIFSSTIFIPVHSSTFKERNSSIHCGHPDDELFFLYCGLWRILTLSAPRLFQARFSMCQLRRCSKMKKQPVKHTVENFGRPTGYIFHDLGDKMQTKVFSDSMDSFRFIKNNVEHTLNLT